MKLGVASLALVLLAAATLTGCSSADDEMYEHFRCAKAATLLEREAEAQNAMMRSYKAGKALGEPNARYFMMLGQRFQDDVPLYRYSAAGQVQLLSRVYKERGCQKMYAPLTREEEEEMARVLGLPAPGQTATRDAVLGEPVAPPVAPPDAESVAAETPVTEPAAESMETSMADAAAQTASLAAQAADDAPVRAVADEPVVNTFRPSFDCARASTDIERLICSDASLSVMDGRMAQAYREGLACGGEGLRAEQRDWIRYTRNLCMDSDCLVDAYAVRMAELGNVCH